MSHARSKRTPCSLLVTALVGAVVVAGVPGCGAPPGSPDRAISSALSVPIGAPPFRDGVYVPINDLVIASTDGAVVTANGNAALSSVGTAFHEAAVDDNGGLTKFSADIRLHSALTLDVGVSVKGTFASTIDLPPVPLPPFQLGPDVVVTPTAFLSFVIEGSAAGVAHVAAVMPFETGVSFTLQDGQPVVQLADTPRFRPLVGGPDVASAVELDLQASVVVGVAFLTEVEGFPIGGPFVQEKLGAELAVSPAATPWWSASGVASLQGGWSFDGTGSATHVVTLAGPDAQADRLRARTAAAGRPVDPLVARLRRWHQRVGGGGRAARQRPHRGGRAVRQSLHGRARRPGDPGLRDGGRRHRRRLRHPDGHGARAQR